MKVRKIDESAEFREVEPGAWDLVFKFKDITEREQFQADLETIKARTGQSESEIVLDIIKEKAEEDY